MRATRTRQLDRRGRARVAVVALLALAAALLTTGVGGGPTAQASGGASAGPLTLLLDAGRVSATFEVRTTAATTLTDVAVAMDPVDSGAVQHVGGAGSTVVDGTRTFRLTGSVPPGTYEARAGYAVDGNWTYGAEAVRVTVSASSAPVPAPAAAPAAPGPTTPPASGSTVGAASGFSPGGAFPFLRGTALSDELDAVVGSGATWVRVDFPWTTVEPTRGSYNWSDLDRVTAAAAERGLKVLALPAYSPAWARGACGSDKCPPTSPDDFARFVAAAGARYASDRVQAWEIWNEPNIPSFWSPRPDADAYARLLKAAVPALRATRPDAYIVSAGLSPAYTDGTSIAPVDFVRRLYAAGAMRGVDAVGIHPYSATELPLKPRTESWNTFLQMKVVHDLMTANGDGHKQVWGTEFGVATGSSRNSTSEAQQAAMITQGYARLADGSWPWLGTLFAYSLRDSGTDLADWQSNFGLRRYDGSPKPAWTAFTSAMRLPLVR
jgi:hypothetical protein